MELTFQQYENIQEYLDGRMSLEKRRAFEKQLEIDALLKEHLNFEIELREGLESLSENETELLSGSHDLPDYESKFDDPAYIRSLVKNAGKEFDQEKKDEKNNNNNLSLNAYGLVNSIDDASGTYGSGTISFSYYTGLAVAASFIILVIGAIWLLTPAPSSTGIAHNNNDTANIKRNTPDILKPDEPDKEALASLFKKFFIKDKAPAEKPEYLAAALDDYERGKYKSIQNHDLINIPGYRGSYLNSKQNVLELGHYYKAIAFMETNNVAEAKKNLQWIIDHAQHRQLVTKSQWYLALAYLQDLNPAKATVLLKIIAENAAATPYNGQAEKLLNALRY